MAKTQEIRYQSEAGSRSHDQKAGPERAERQRKHEHRSDRNSALGDAVWSGRERPAGYRKTAHRWEIAHPTIGNREPRTSPRHRHPKGVPLMYTNRH